MKEGVSQKLIFQSILLVGWSTQRAVFNGQFFKLLELCQVMVPQVEPGDHHLQKLCVLFDGDGQNLYYRVFLLVNVDLSSVLRQDELALSRGDCSALIGLSS